MSNPPPVIESPDNTPPDWDSHPADLLCPLCQYNLRHLTVARCPECGFTFRWQELLKAEKEKHNYLFEHGNRRNFKTFCKTYWRTSLPRRFWREVNPAQPVRLRRLLVYWAIAMVMAAICLNLFSMSVGGKLAYAYALARSDFARRDYILTSNGRATANYGGGPIITPANLDDYYPLPWHLKFWERVLSYSGRYRSPNFYYYSSRNEYSSSGATMLLMAWPFLTLICLMVFRASMFKAKIRTVHLLRTVIYCCDFGLLFGLIFAVYSFCDLRLTHASLLSLTILCCGVITTYRLSIAFQKYLRVHLAVATVIASQIMAMLLAAIVLAWTVDWR